jgi:hypothetical protein
VVCEVLKKLEELLARPAKSGKEKMRSVLEFLRNRPPQGYPCCLSRDLAMHEDGFGPLSKNLAKKAMKNMKAIEEAWKEAMEAMEEEDMENSSEEEDLEDFSSEEDLEDSSEEEDIGDSSEEDYMEDCD